MLNYVNLRSGEQLTHEHPERPEVDRSVVTLVQDNLRGHVFRGAAERPRLAALGDALGEAKVDLARERERESVRLASVPTFFPTRLCPDHFDVSFGVEEEVFRLEVPVDDPSAVQVVHGADDAGDVEPRCGVVEPAPVSQDGPQLAAQARLHQQVDVLAVAEGAVQPVYVVAKLRTDPGCCF